MASDGYRAVLRLPRVRQVMAFTCAGRLAYGMVPFSVVVAVARTHGFAVAGVASAVLMLAIAVPGPARGRIVDRRGPKMLITFACVCVGLLTAAALLLGSSLWVVAVVLIGLGGAAAPPVSGAARTSWSRLVADKTQLQQMHALDSTVEELTFVVAPLLTTALLHLLPARLSMVIGAGLLIPSALGLISFGQLGHGVDRASTAERTGIRLGSLLRRRAAQGIVIPIVALGIVGGSLGILLPAGAAHGGDIASAGYPFAVFSAGGLVGGLLYGRHKWKASLRTRYLFATLGLAAGTVVLIPLITTALAIPAVFLVGLAMTPMYILAFLIVNEHIEPARHTEANSWIGAGYNMGSAAGSTVAGALIAHVSITGGTTVASIAAFLGAVSVLAIPVATPHAATEPQPSDFSAEASSS
jgi:MFS family permease